MTDYHDGKCRDIALFPEENPFPVMRVSNQSDLLYANRTALKILSPWHCAIGEQVPDFIFQKVKESLQENIRLSLEMSFSRRFYSLTLVPIVEQGYVNFYGQDVTQSKLAIEQLKQSEMRFHQIADFMPQLVWTADPSGNVDYYNERRKEFEGFTQSEDGRWSWAPVVHPDDQHETIEAWKKAYQTGTAYEIKHRIKRSNGRFTWYLSRAFPIRDETGKIIKWFGTATDIDDIKKVEIKLAQAKKAAEEANQKLKELASTDVVTGLQSRRAFMEEAQSLFQIAERYQRPFSFLIIDIDHFKKVNDTYGHLGGDVVLVELGKIMSSCLRATDILGRIGGEEFAVILPETGPDHTAELIERLLEKVRTTEIRIDDDTLVSVTVSIGVATVPPLPIHVGKVMAAADKALYQAKSDGRNRCCEASMDCHES